MQKPRLIPTWATVSPVCIGAGAGIASAQNTGVEIEAVGVSGYLMGYQADEKAYPTPLCWGDLMGCAWTGTAHASTSTRTAARWQQNLANCLNNAEGTIVVAWQPDRANTTYSADNYLFTTRVTEMRAYFDFTNDRWVFTDNTNTINGQAHTFAAPAPQVLHFVFEQGSLKIYRNGSL